MQRLTTCGLLLGWLDSLSRFIGIVAIDSKSLIGSGRRATFINLVHYNFKFNFLTWRCNRARRFSNVSPAASRRRWLPFTLISKYLVVFKIHPRKVPDKRPVNRDYEKKN